MPVSHRFRASSFAVVRLEELNEVANLKADLVACYKPVNSQELFAIERIALAQQAILRAARLEAGLFTSALNEATDPYDGRPYTPMSRDMVGDGDIEITRAQNRNYGLAEGFRKMAKESNAWSLLLRYQVQAERMYRRAIEEFERLKRLRPELPTEPDCVLPDSPEDIAPLSDINPTIQIEAEGVPQALSPVETIPSRERKRAVFHAPVNHRHCAQPYNQPQRNREDAGGAGPRNLTHS